MDFSDNFSRRVRSKFVRIRKRTPSPKSWVIPRDLPVLGKLNATNIGTLHDFWNKWMKFSDAKKDRHREAAKLNLAFLKRMRKIE